MARVTAKAASDAADKFLAVKAAQAELAKQETELKSILLAFYKATGKANIEGQLARVTISETAGRETIDMDKLALVLPAPVIKSLMKQGAPSTRFTCHARASK